jgi:hypothetical protein
LIVSLTFQIFGLMVSRWQAKLWITVQTVRLFILYRRWVINVTPKQQIFADEYLKDTNGTRAYKVAYPQVKKDQVAAAAAGRC